MNLLSNSAFQRVCLLLFAAISSSISLAADCTPTSLSETDANAANAVFVRYKDMQPSQGAFKVSASKTVYFAKSNLQFGGCSVWRFAENAWDLGNGWTDLFNWATSGRYHSQGGMLGASKNYALGDDFNQSMTGTYQEADWGYYNTIINGSNASKRWTVLTKAEWEYLLNDTQIYGFATVNGVKGIILIPNAFDWTTSGLKYTKANFHHVKKDQTSGTTMTNALNNTLTAAQWKVFEDRGAVFLPDNNAMGAFLSGWWRPSSEACPLFTQAMCDQWTAFAANRGYYWTSSHASISGDYYYSHCLFFDNSNCELQTDYYPKNYFFSVRCVTTNKSTYATNNYGLDAQITNNTGGSITATFDATHRSCALKANVSSGYIFTHWMKGTTVFDASGSTEIPSTTVKAGDQYSAYFLTGTDVTSLRWFADGVGVSTTARNMQGAKAWIYIGGTLVKSNQAITQLDYGYYKVPIANLDNLSNAGKKLRIVFLNSCNEPVNVLEEDAVPVIVSGNKSFSTFITNATADNYLFTDIVVLNNAVFNMDVSISNFTFRYLRIYPGAKVILPTGTPRIYSYGVYMYADAVADSYPQLLKNNGTVLNYYNISYTTQWVDGQAVRVPVVQRNSNSPTLRLFYVLDYKLYYPLCLPVGHQLRYSYQAFRPELEIRYYDGAKRIAQETGWTVADHTTTSDGSHDLQAGKGYIVYAVPNLWNGNRRKKVIVTFGNTTAYLNSSGERNFNSTVLAAGDESVPPSERNWNLIGNPFLCNMGGEAASSDNIKLGYLRDVYGDGLWTDGTYYDEEVRYLTIPLNGFRKYRQLKASEAVVKPFNVFFVQTTGTQKPVSPTIVCPLAETFAPLGRVPFTLALPLFPIETENPR